MGYDDDDYLDIEECEINENKNKQNTRIQRSNRKP